MRHTPNLFWDRLDKLCSLQHHHQIDCVSWGTEDYSSNSEIKLKSFVRTNTSETHFKCTKNLLKFTMNMVQSKSLLQKSRFAEFQKV